MTELVCDCGARWDCAKGAVACYTVHLGQQANRAEHNWHTEVDGLTLDTRKKAEAST